MKRSMRRAFAAGAALLTFEKSILAQNQDIGDVADRLNGFGSNFSTLLITLAGVAGLGFMIAGILMLVKKEHGPQNSGGKLAGFVMLLGGGALFGIVAIRAIFSSSITG